MISSYKVSVLTWVFLFGTLIFNACHFDDATTIEIYLIKEEDSNQDIVQELTVELQQVLSADDRLIKVKLSYLSDAFSNTLEGLQDLSNSKKLLLALQSTSIRDILEEYKIEQQHFLLVQDLIHVYNDLLKQGTYTPDQVAIIVQFDSHERPYVDSYPARILPPFDPNSLDQLAYEIFWKFEEAQNLIANEANEAIIEELIVNTERLFIEPNVLIEVRNKNKSHFLSVQQYLRRMADLHQYDSIQISWEKDIKIMENWKQLETEMPTGKTYMSARQNFSRFTKDIRIYGDSMDKNIELHAKLVESIDISGNLSLQWKVYLGNIRVIEYANNLNEIT